MPPHAGERSPEGGAVHIAARNLGPVTEGRFEATFAVGALATAKAAAALVGLDTDTLSEMTDAGIIRAVRKGRLRSYTEHDLRAFLLSGPDAPSRAKEARAPSMRRSAVVPFSKRRGG
jgi:hypothetical protein